MQWQVLRPDRLPPGDWVVFALSPRDYENLLRNDAEVIRWVTEARWRLENVTLETTK